MLPVVPSCLSHNFILGLIGDEDWYTCIEHHPTTHCKGNIEGDHAGNTRSDSQGQLGSDIEEDLFQTYSMSILSAS